MRPDEARAHLAAAADALDGWYGRQTTERRSYVGDEHEVIRLIDAATQKLYRIRAERDSGSGRRQADGRPPVGRGWTAAVVVAVVGGLGAAYPVAFAEHLLLLAVQWWRYEHTDRADRRALLWLVLGVVPGSILSLSRASRSAAVQAPR